MLHQIFIHTSSAHCHIKTNSSLDMYFMIVVTKDYQICHLIFKTYSIIILLTIKLTVALLYKYSPIINWIGAHEKQWEKKNKRSNIILKFCFAHQIIVKQGCLYSKVNHEYLFLNYMYEFCYYPCKSCLISAQKFIIQCCTFI